MLGKQSNLCGLKTSEGWGGWRELREVETRVIEIREGFPWWSSG